MSLKTIQQKYAAKAKTKTKRPTTGSRCGRLAKRRAQLEQDLAKTNAEYDAEVAALRESTEAAEAKVHAQFAERSAKLEDEKQRELAQIHQRLECKIGEGKRSAKKASKRPTKKAGKKAGKKASKKPASKPAKKAGKKAAKKAGQKTAKKTAAKKAEPSPPEPTPPVATSPARPRARKPRAAKPSSDETVSPQVKPACGTCVHPKPAYTEADVKRGMKQERKHHPDLDDATLRQVVVDHLTADPNRYKPTKKPMSEQDKVNYAMGSLADMLSNLSPPGG